MKFNDLSFDVQYLIFSYIPVNELPLYHPVAKKCYKDHKVFKFSHFNVPRDLKHYEFTTETDQPVNLHYKYIILHTLIIDRFPRDNYFKLIVSPELLATDMALSGYNEIEFTPLHEMITKPKVNILLDSPTVKIPKFKDVFENLMNYNCQLINLQISHVTKLTINDNLDEDEFKRLSLNYDILQELNLSNNCFQSFEFNMKLLKSLDLSRNFISSLSTNFKRQTPNLKLLNLSRQWSTIKLKLDIVVPKLSIDLSGNTIVYKHIIGEYREM